MDYCKVPTQLILVVLRDIWPTVLILPFKFCPEMGVGGGRKEDLGGTELLTV